MQLPRISVITPTLNQSEFIEQTILSVVGQGYPNLEYIIIDGGSTDGTVEIIKRYRARLAYWVSEPDRGQAHAINKGFERATGDIFCWINSDDLFFPGVFHRIVAALYDTKSPMLVYGSCLMFNVGQAWANIRKPVSPFDKQLFKSFDFIDQPSTFWTRRLWEMTGNLDESLCYVFDWDWFIRASEIGDFQSTNELVSAYRSHNEHKTGKGKGKRRREIIDLIARYAGNRWGELYREVDEKLLPALDTIQKFNGFRGAWRAEPVMRFLMMKICHADLYLKFGSNDIRRAIDMLNA